MPVAGNDGVAGPFTAIASEVAIDRVVAVADGDGIVAGRTFASVATVVAIDRVVPISGNDCVVARDAPFGWLPIAVP